MHTSLVADEVRRSGKELQAEWIKQRDALADCWADAIANRPPMPWDQFGRTILDYRDGNPKTLIDYLRFNAPITQMEHAAIADAYSCKFNRSKAKGRPKDIAARNTAFAARVFLNAWKQRNIALGISNHGFAEMMKEESARYVVEELEPYDPPLDIDRVVDLMNRPKSRRNSTDDRAEPSSKQYASPVSTERGIHEGTST